jgi:hypothetical protein
MKPRRTRQPKGSYRSAETSVRSLVLTCSTQKLPFASAGRSGAAEPSAVQAAVSAAGRFSRCRLTRAG